MKHVPPIDSENIDLCFLLELVEDLCNTVASVLDMKNKIAKLQSATLALSQVSLQTVVRPPATVKVSN